MRSFSHGHGWMVGQPLGMMAHSWQYPCPGRMAGKSTWNARVATPRTTLSQSGEELHDLRELSEWLKGLLPHPGSWGLWEKIASMAWAGMEGVGRQDGAGCASRLVQSWPWAERSCTNTVCPIAADKIWWAPDCTVYQAFWMSPSYRADGVKKECEAGHIYNQAPPPVTRPRSWAQDNRPSPILKPLWVTHSCDWNGIFYLMPLQVIYSNLKKIFQHQSSHPYSVVSYP